MSKEGYNGRLQGAPGVALSCPALLSPGINIHCAAAPPSSASGKPELSLPHSPGAVMESLSGCPFKHRIGSPGIFPGAF